MILTSIHFIPCTGIDIFCHRGHDLRSQVRSRGLPGSRSLGQVRTDTSGWWREGDRHQGLIVWWLIDGDEREPLWRRWCWSCSRYARLPLLDFFVWRAFQFVLPHQTPTNETNETFCRLIYCMLMGIHYTLCRCLNIAPVLLPHITFSQFTVSFSPLELFRRLISMQYDEIGSLLSGVLNI